MFNNQTREGGERKSRMGGWRGRLRVFILPHSNFRKIERMRVSNFQVPNSKIVRRIIICLIFRPKGVYFFCNNDWKKLDKTSFCVSEVDEFLWQGLDGFVVSEEGKDAISSAMESFCLMEDKLLGDDKISVEEVSWDEGDDDPGSETYRLKKSWSFSAEISPGWGVANLGREIVEKNGKTLVVIRWDMTVIASSVLPLP